MKGIKTNSLNQTRTKLKSFFDFSVLSIDDNGKRLIFLALFIPKLCELLFAKLTATFTTLLISGYAENAVGATTSATQVVSIFTIILNVTTVGATILVSIELGRGDRVRAGRIVATSLMLIMISSGLISFLLFIFAEPLLLILNLEGEALAYGTVYLKIRGGLLFLPIISSFLGSMLVCNGKAFHVMVAGIISNTMNVLFIYLLLYVKLIPGLSGTAAVAVATEISCLASIIYSSVVFCICKCPFLLEFDKRFVGKIYALGIPGSIATFSYSMAITFTVGFIGAMGIVSLNAYSYTNNIVGYAAMFSSVASSCVSVFVGRYAGRGDIDAIKKLCRIAMSLSMLLNSLAAIIILILRRSLLSMFTSSEQIFSMCLIIFMIDCFIECGRGIVNVMEAAMNASRNVIVTMLSGIISAWGAIVLLSYILGIVLGLGLVGCWIAFAVSEWTKATVYLVYFKKGKWIRNII